jgi:hypothetical protein
MWAVCSIFCDIIIAISMSCLVRLYTVGFFTRHEAERIVAALSQAGGHGHFHHRQKASPSGGRNRNFNQFVSPRTLYACINDVMHSLAVTTLIYLILYFSFPTKPYHATPMMILAKLYSNAMMVIFNSRIHIAGGREPHSAAPLHISFGDQSRGENLDSIEARVVAQPEVIHIQRDIVVHHDEVKTKEQARIYHFIRGSCSRLIHCRCSDSEEGFQLSDKALKWGDY